MPYGYTLEPAEAHGGESIDSEGFKALLGQKKKYPELLEFFEKELSVLGEGKVLEKYAPVLVPGLVGALTHGIIQLGWALDFGSRPMLIEGSHLLLIQLDTVATLPASTDDSLRLAFHAISAPYNFKSIQVHGLPASTDDSLRLAFHAISAPYNFNSIQVHEFR